jgi:hypothetical protein
MTTSRTSPSIAHARSPKDQPMHPTTTTPTNGSGSVGASRRRPRTARAARALTILAAAATATLSLTAAPALADECQNEALRAENNSTQLPECRAYEQVTPLFKEGFAPVPEAFTDDGRLAYHSAGNVANNGYGYAGGNAYIAVRSASGWSTTALAPSGPEFVPSGAPGFPYQNPSTQAAFSSDLRSSLWAMRRADEPATVVDLYVRSPEGAFTRTGSVSDAYGNGSGSLSVSASDDLSHVSYSAQDGQTYEYVGTNGQRRAVSVDNAGEPLDCGRTIVNAMSDDGDVMFLTCHDDIYDTSLDALYARVNGTTTVDLSGPRCSRLPNDPRGECKVQFQGANAAGTRAYFTTDEPLVSGDTDDTNDLYECEIPTGLAPVGTVNPCPSLREVSGAVTGANVLGVALVSDDGSRVYFTATGVLASNLGANGASAAAGDHNLYVWTRDASHPEGEMRFVTKLDTGGNFQATDDGRYLVFATNDPLIDHGPQADTDTASDVYRYDAETGELLRLSTDFDGEGGNEPGQDANFTSVGAMSDDGSSVVFMTAESLALNDTNGTVDTYLWHDGRVSLISSGRPSDDQAAVLNNPFGSVPQIQAVISPSGNDVYFTTTAQLVPGDVDTVMDTYDARVDGGFFTPPQTPCSEETCQGPASPLPLPLIPGSTSSTGQAGPGQTTPAFSVRGLTARQLERVASTGKVSLSVTTNAPGVLSAQATATIAQRSSTVGSAKRSVAKAGTVSLSLTLSKTARAQLKSERKLTVKVLVRQDNVAISRTVSLKLTQPTPAKKKAKKKKSSSTTSRHAAAKGGRS